jgi:CRISPR system Cascade subunit CasA
MNQNLLTDPIFTVDSADGLRATLSLPAVLHRLALGTSTDFGALQAHQIQSWESFLVQLGALATVSEGGTVPKDEAGWHRALLALTGGEVSPWQLVVDDPRKSAFMQPPIVGDDYRTSNQVITSPDGLDLLVTAKNHDVKEARATRARSEHWVFALVSVQTCDGYPGKNTYGIARMNGGFGSRPSLGATAGLSLDARFLRDLRLWTERRAGVAKAFGMRAVGGHALLWTVPWDGHESLPITALDPCFIEVCRQFRLGNTPRGVMAWRKSTTVSRVDAKARKGELGDIWIPIKRGAERAAFTSSEEGFSYKKVAELLLGEEFDRAPAMEQVADDRGPVMLLARVLVRGQGKTEGLHERLLPIPAGARRFVFGAKTERDAVGRLAKERVEDVAKVQNKVLHVALCALLQAAAPDEKLDLKDDRTKRWKQDFDDRIDAIFFESLWGDLELAANDPNAARVSWQRRALELARLVFREALDAVPLPSVRAYRARAVAERRFESSARYHFADAGRGVGAIAPREESP